MSQENVFKKLSESEQAYMDELISIIRRSSSGVMTKQKISALKTRLCKKHGLHKPPRDMDIIMLAKPEDLSELQHLRTKPTRSLSGVAVVAVMTRPDVCPHGKCTFCPGGLGSAFGDTPPSYTGFEPATRRGIRNDYDSFLQVFNRLEQYALGGHNPNKIDLIVMGGTFPSYDETYQYQFVVGVYLAMNAFSDLFYTQKGNTSTLNFDAFKEWFELPHEVINQEIEERLKKKMYALKEKYLSEISHLSWAEKLEYVKDKNETAAVRCIGLTEETRPDCSFLYHANNMLLHGVTRVELGVQTIYNDVLDETFRAHSVEDSIKATQVLKDLGFKVNFHMMLGLPLTTPQMDYENLQAIFQSPLFRPDMIKIYPCLVMAGTKLYRDYEKGLYKPIDLVHAAEAIGKFLPEVPEYCRIMRIQRDIPSTLVEGGVQKTNLKQYVEQYMEKHNLVCRDIRAREIARQKVVNPVAPTFEISFIEYEASGGTEFFIQAEDTANDILIGFCRLRFVKECLRPEFTPTSAIVRELHVYGSALNIGQAEGNYAEITGQHKGWGKKLMEKAEAICKERGKNKLLVIAGVGVREYYRNIGYTNDGPYVSKLL